MAKRLKNVENKVGHKAFHVAVIEGDPKAELRRLVMEHKAMTKKAVAFEAMISDRTNHETGEVIPCRGINNDRRSEMSTVIDAIRKDAQALEIKMARELKQHPVYQLFLKNVFGIGPIVASYLVAELDPRGGRDPITGQYLKPAESIKPSAFRRFCGLAVIDGHLERPQRGAKNAYSSEMRTRLYQAFSAMWKNAAKSTTWVMEDKLPPGTDTTGLEKRDTPDGKVKYEMVREDAPLGTTCKYLDIWNNYKVRMAQSERLVDTKIVNGAGKTVSAKGFIHSTGWHKAADVLIEDLYIVWRALEGLPVWPSYYAAKLGYEHGGKICVNAPKMLTVDEALALVGDVGGRARQAA